MTGRDLRWRATGTAIAGAAWVASLLDTESPLTLVYFLGAIFGIVLMLNGKRVAIAWRAERSGHRDTAAVIHAQRIRRRRRD